MERRRGAGDLRHRYAFDKRINVKDGFGNLKGSWEQQFDCRAGLFHLRGGEKVMADRLEGHHSQIVFVRMSSLTRLVSTDWRVRDVRAGEFVDGIWKGPSFNIRDVTPTNDRAWLDFLVQSGGAD